MAEDSTPTRCLTLSGRAALIWARASRVKAIEALQAAWKRTAMRECMYAYAPRETVKPKHQSGCPREGHTGHSVLTGGRKGVLRPLLSP